MFPDLTGLSHEEAALVTDVLSRLSLRKGPVEVQDVLETLQPLQLADVEELDLATTRIEQELRGLQVPARASLIGQPGTTNSHDSLNCSTSGYPGRTGAAARALPVGAYSSAQMADMSLELAGAHMARGQHASPAPNELNALSSSRDDALGPSATAACGAGTPNPIHTSDGRFAYAAAVVDGPSPTTPKPAASILHELREKLRQQQKRQAFPEAATGSSCAANAGQRDAGDVASGPRQHIAPDRDQQYGATEEPAARASVSPEGNYFAVVTASHLSGKALVQPRRSLPPSPAAAAKAFTMLNARTSAERYGGDGGQEDGKASTNTKTPVKLPEHERSARLQQLYERTIQWRRRCDERYAKARHDREALELEGCTFTPKVTAASQLIMQGKSPSKIYQEFSKWSTPTKHQHTALQQRTPSPGVTPGAHGQRQYGTASADRGAGSPYVTNEAAAQSRTPMHGVDGVPSVLTASACSNPTAASSSAGNASRPGDVGQRLYQRAFQIRARQEERLFQQLHEEERQRRFTASVQGVMPRVYNPPEPPSTRHLPTGMEECTFHPNRAVDDSEYHPENRCERPLSNRQGGQQSRSISRGSSAKHVQDLYGAGAASTSSRTSPARTPPRPKSAPHIRGADGDSRSRSPSPRCDVHAPGGATAAAYRPPSRSPARGPRSVHTTVSIGPDLDWDEFLARQERFLASREYKLHVLEQTEPAVPRMSPGSRKLLRERAVRQGPANPQVASGAGDGVSSMQLGGHSQPGNPSPCRQDRRVRTIMEMYKDCTFQPQITRRAAALPSRNIDDLVEGGRAKRAEWAEQQRALQQAREVEGATFRPQVSSGAYTHVRPRISLQNPDAYLAHLADKQRQREALRAELECEREALELQHCTFKPQVTPLPAYLIRRLQEQQQQQYAQQVDVAGEWEGGSVATQEENLASTEDGYAGYYDSEYGDQPTEVYESQAGMSDYVSMLADEALEMPSVDAHHAYQRALQYAMSHPQNA